MTSVAVLVLEVGGLLVGATAPWRVGVGGRLAAVREPGGAVRYAHGGRPPGSARRADRRGAAPSRDVVLLLDLLDMAVSAGAGVPRALEAVGEAVGGADGERLTRVSVELLLGAPWPAAWAGTSDGLRPIAECLEAAWVQGAAPGPALRARAGVVRRDRRRAAREAAGRLGVHLVLPLGLCFLPAFVLLGLVPVVVSLASGFAI
ncbi:MAG TPA: type II secretion system F family protein [Cellulomonas sp.]|uniref:type II secretion system F family protein n=1 Tax=Cellulomonas sp. TaxID=40001 RepID=UPI002E31C3BA|nr:type II secretion system F family protein [Cellulomonas sp.]HEX5331693.1 type II secretion system F family protein [Cellulomonas sp.]